MIQLGIIGCGDVAFRSYVPALESLKGDARVAACFDPLAERAERAAARFEGATPYTTYDRFLAHPGLQGVFNLTPAPLHRETTVAALDHGLHVFTEKPIAGGVEDAQALIAHADKLGRTLMSAPAIMASRRFRWLKDMIGEGRLGRLTLANAQMATMGPAGWRAYTGDPAVFYAANVGPVLDIGVYALHAITGLFGPAKRVQAFGGIAIPKRKVLIERLAGQEIDVQGSDIMMIHLDFGGNAFAQLLASFAVPRSKVPGLEIHGTNGTVSIAMDQWYNGDGPVDVFLRDDSLLGMEGWMEGVAAPEAGPPSNMLGAGPAHFVAVLEGRERPILTAEHATHVLDIVLTANRSVAEGRALETSTGF